MTEPKEIEAQITIIATYEDAITITVEDKASGTRFLQMVMTREQFVNATMDRLGNTDVLKAEVRNLDRVGKKMEMRPFTFELPAGTTTYDNRVEELAGEIAMKVCPEGWTPDCHFGSRGSIFSENGKCFARTTLRRWV